jgi:hypothetical protein
LALQLPGGLVSRERAHVDVADAHALGDLVLLRSVVRVGADGGADERHDQHHDRDLELPSHASPKV